jgi:hypothetical protein
MSRLIASVFDSRVAPFGERRCGWGRLALAAVVGAVAFNISQRVLDYLLDHLFEHIGWLAWLAN